MRRRTIFLSAAALAGLAGLRSLARRSASRLDNLVVVVTGASRGLGLGLAREFGKRGCRLAICARNDSELERAAADLRARGIDVFSASCDVRDRSSVERFIRAVTSHYGAIDVLVNNAGIIEVGPLSTMTEEDYADAMQTHFWGAYHTVEAALPALKAARGRIVNIVSIGGLVAVPHLAPYSASKFALLGYSLALNAELARNGIAVTTVCPGLMRTGSARNAWFKGRNVDEYGWFSLGAALPFTSVSTGKAAKSIVNATARRAKLVVLTAQAQVLAAMQHAFPSVTLAALQIVVRLLPREGGIEDRAVRGYESESPLTQSFLTALSKRAEIDLLQR